MYFVNINVRIKKRNKDLSVITMSSPTEDNITNYPNSIETRVALVEMAIVNINQTLTRLENKMDQGFNALGTEIKDVRTEMKEIRTEMKTDFRWILAIIAGLGAIMAHGFHWY